LSEGIGTALVGREKGEAKDSVVKCYRSFSAYLSLGMLLCLGSAGCGGTGPAREGQAGSATGKVTNAGVPLEVNAPLLTVEVVFAKDEGAGKQADPKDVYRARVKEDGTFQLSSAGKAIPPGKYRIGVRHWSFFVPTGSITPGPRPVKKGQWFVEGKGDDLLKGKFDEASSPIVREITEKDRTVDIDVSKPQG
jgi:hypothetical protein